LVVNDFAHAMNSDALARGRVAEPVKPLVVVVDDEGMVGDVVQAMLELGGFRSLHFQDPREALAWFQGPDGKPDLMLTDFLMPHMTGLELIQRVKEVRPDLKTILYSGHVEERESDNYPKRPDRFLRKPFNAKTLIGVVKSVLEGTTSFTAAPRRTP
jgi:two-component system, cell cycle sensor histidine kinase and response regulator CckA